MSTGIKVSDDVVAAFNDLKIGHKYRYVVCKIADESEVVVETKADTSATYEDFVGSLPDDDCRYCVFDYEFEKDGGKRNKILLITWAPDTAKIKPKMLYTGTHRSVKQKLVGIQVEIQATDNSEISEEAVIEKVNRV